MDGIRIRGFKISRSINSELQFVDRSHQSRHLQLGYDPIRRYEPNPTAEQRRQMARTSRQLQVDKPIIPPKIVLSQAAISNYQFN